MKATPAAQPQTDPQTPEQWQDAVNLAHFFMAIDSARQYGLIAGGPTVNIERCEVVLTQGREKGITPNTPNVIGKAEKAARAAR
jgi:hypothetical protein